MRTIKLFNIILLILLVALLVNLIQPLNIITGNIIYSIDASEPRCYFHNSNNLQEIPIDKCCYQIQKQLTCKSTDEQLELKCYTSETSERYYLINIKTFSYCKKEGYDVKVE